MAARVTIHIEAPILTTEQCSQMVEASVPEIAALLRAHRERREAESPDERREENAS